MQLGLELVLSLQNRVVKSTSLVSFNLLPCFALHITILSRFSKKGRVLWYQPWDRLPYLLTECFSHLQGETLAEIFLISKLVSENSRFCLCRNQLRTNHLKERSCMWEIASWTKAARYWRDTSVIACVLHTHNRNSELQLSSQVMYSRHTARDSPFRHALSVLHTFQYALVASVNLCGQLQWPASVTNTIPVSLKCLLTVPKLKLLQFDTTTTADMYYSLWCAEWTFQLYDIYIHIWITTQERNHMPGTHVTDLDGSSWSQLGAWPPWYRIPWRMDLSTVYMS